MCKFNFLDILAYYDKNKRFEKFGNFTFQPEWMNQKKFKKVKSKLKAKVNKFTPNKYGIGPHKKVLRTAKKGKAKK